MESFLEREVISDIADDFKTLEGAPCSIQVFTPTMRDEECLQMAK
jgi:amidase